MLTLIAALAMSATLSVLALHVINQVHTTQIDIDPGTQKLNLPREIVDFDGDGNLDVLMISNAISNNDTTATVNRDMNVLNSSLGSVCLAMSNNFFVLPVRLENLGAGVDFVLELDGSTNGIGVPGIQVGAFDLRAFGSTCAPAIAAQEAVFAGLGF